jgi:hypothetical protein
MHAKSLLGLSCLNTAAMHSEVVLIVPFYVHISSSVPLVAEFLQLHVVRRLLV